MRSQKVILASVFIGCCARRRVFIGCCGEGTKCFFLGGGQFCRSNILNQIGFNLILIKRVYEKPNTSLCHDMERRKVKGYKLLYKTIPKQSLTQHPMVDMSPVQL